MVREERSDLWRGMLDKWAGSHPFAEDIEQFVRDELDSGSKARLSEHLRRCSACRHFYRELMPSHIGALVLPLRALRSLGSLWLGQPLALAAKDQELGETRLEYVTSGESRLDVRVTPSDALLAALTETGDPLAGWRVRLERIDATGRVVAEEAAAVTDADGRANLGSARRKAVQGETFRVVAERPWDSTRE